MKKEASGKKAKWLWLVLGIVALLAVVGVVLALVLGGGKGKTVGGRPDLYWNVDKVENVDRDTGLSIRKPAEDGVYYVRFAHDGEQVEIPVADKKLVNYIDSLDLMSLTLDDNGYVVDILPVKDVASIIGESLYVQSVNGDTLIANSSIMMNGRKITIKLNEQTGVYNVSGKGEFVGEALDASKLNPMDTISAYGTFVAEDSEEESEVTHVFVLKKPAESKIYFRADQFYDSSKKETTREPDENGAYTIKWYCEGETVELKCKDKAMVSTIDSANYHWCHWGLEFDEEGYIIDILDSFLASRTLMQCERYDITELDDDGNYTATSLIKNNGAFVQGTVGADCAIYDISSAAKSEGQDNRKVDKLQLGDRVCIWTDTMGNPVQIYVTARRVDVPAFWNITRSYSSTTMQTTRTPNDKGIYEIEMLKAGDTKKTVYYTDDIEIATAVDKTADLVVGMKVGEGNKIEYVYDIESLFGNTYFVRGYYILDATGTVCTYLTPSGSGATKNGVLAADAKVYNISTIGKYGAETTLQPGDYVYAGKTPTGEVAYAFVVRRVLKNGENMFYWRIDERKYDSKEKVTTREKKDGYYTYLFAHEGQQVTLKTDNIEFATALDYQSSSPAFALEVKGDIITKVHEGTYAYGGTRYNGWTIDAINGKKIEVTSSSGSKGTWDISDAKIFNVSNSFSSHKGEKISSLKVGDVLANYRDINGTPKVIIVKTRRTNKMAWPVAPQTNRPKNEDGWYYVDLAVDGKIQTFKVKSENLMKAIDEYTSPFGIEVSGNQILYMSTTTYVEGVKGTGVTTVTVESASKSSAKILHTLGAADKVGTRETLSIASGAKIYDVTEEARVAGKLGSVTTLKKGDVIRTYKDADGNQLYIYVISRQTKDAYSYCAHCDKPVYWTPYVPSSNAGSNDAHYYLATDLLDMPSQIRVYSTSKDFEIVLDLNGNVASRTGGRLALVRYNDTLTIIDTSADKSGKLMSKDSTSNGGVIMISQDTKTYGEAGGPGIVNLGTENVWGGTITLDPASTQYAASGGLITSSAIFNMYDGKLENGKVQTKPDSESIGGGAINSSGTVNIYGGTIIGGVADGHCKDAEGNDVIKAGFGGNIRSSGVLNIYKDAVIKDGQAARGGNIYNDAGECYIHDGSITGGKANLAYGKSTDARGGNIFSTGNLYIKGGTVSDGQTIGKDYGGNIMSTGLNKTVYISGGTISGGAYVNGDTTKLSNIYLMYSNIEVTGGEINGGEKTGALIGCTGTNTGGYSTITIAGGTIKGDVNGGGGVTTFKDNAGQKYYTSDGKDINVYFREDGTAYTLSSKNKEVAFYPNYKAIINLKGGKVEGTVNAETTQQINISGNPDIKMLKIGSNKVNVTTMSAGASITTDAVGTISNAMASKAAADAVVAGQYIKSTNTELILGATDKNELKIYHPRAIVAYCEHCEGDADFIPTSVLPTGAGHYVLTDDVTVTESATEKTGACIAKGVATVLDLAGHTVTGGDNIRPFHVAGTLSIIDSSDAETGMITGGSATRGGNIYVSGGTFQLYSGTIAGGVADQALTVGTSTTNGRGGNIFSTGNVYLYGGKVIGGVAKTGSGYGGNICITAGSASYSLYIGEGVIVSDGEAKTGGNIYVMYSKATLDGGIITGGTATTGENVYTSGTNTGGISTFTAKSGEITDGDVYISGDVTKIQQKEDGSYYYVSSGTEVAVVYKDGTPYYIDTKDNNEEKRLYPDYRSAFVLEGGNLDCKVYANTSSMTISGKPVVKELQLAEGVLAEVGTLNEGASVAVNAAYGVISEPVANKTAAETAIANGYIAAFNSNTDKIALNDKNELIVTSKVEIVTKTIHCEHCGQDVPFTSWYGAPIAESGHYFVADTVNLTSAISVTSGKDIVIDLNGQRIAADGCRAFAVNGAALTIQDSVGNGEIYGGTAGTGRGGNIYAYGGSTLKLYGGKIYGGTSTADWNNEGHDVAARQSEFLIDGNVQIGQAYTEGHAVYVFDCTSVNLIEGTIIGGLHMRSDVTLGDGIVIDRIGARSGEKVLSVGALTLTEPIQVMFKDNIEGVFTAALNNAATAATYFKAANADQEIVVNNDGTLEIKNKSTEPDPGPGTEPDPSTTPCPHCDGATWAAWDGVATNGHFYLTGNVTLTDDIELVENDDLVIDLRGCTITAATGKRAFTIGENEHLSICDTTASATAWGKVIGSSLPADATDNYGGTIYIAAGSFDLHSGEITGGSAIRGGNIYLTTDGTMNIKGGKITAGTSTGTTGSSASTSGRGGNIYQNSGTTTISGDAAIVGGQVFKSTGNSGRGGNIFINGGTVILKGQATVTGGQTDADGGNIFVNAATLKIQENATISSGTATARANNVYVMYSTLEMSGGTIDAGEVTTGTSIYTNGTPGSGAAILNITGGTINGGVVTLFGGEQAADPENNKEYVDYRSQVTISDATLNCELYVSRASKLEISGNTVIQKLTLADGYYITAVGALGTDASIKINKTEGVFTDVLANANDVVSFFDAVEDGYNAAVTTDGKLEIVEDTTGGNTPGGEPENPTFDCEHCDDANIVWTPWDANTVVDDAIVSGHYYLTENVTVGETNIGIAADQNVVIDLNGKTITASAASRAFYVYGTLSIQDSSAEKTGAIVGGTVSGANGGTIYVTTNATFNLYSGTIRGGSAQRGGNIYVGASGTTFNMYGGAVIGGTADQSLTTGTSTTNGRGGNIFGNGGAVNIERGTISDGVTLLNSAGKGSSWAGNILMNGGTLTVKEGVVIENGTAKAGANLYLVAATLNMTGGQINGGVATDGRTVCITGTNAAGGATMNISGGTFNGGKISMEGDVQQEDAANNKAYVDYRTNVNITGGTFDCQIDVNKAFENVINVSGAPVIKSIKLGEGILMNVGTLTEGANILVNAVSGVVATFEDATAAEAAKAYMDVVAYNKTLAVSGNNLEVVAACECGCKTPAAEIVWDDANAFIAALAQAGTGKINDGAVHHLKLFADLDVTAEELYGAGKQVQVINGTKVALDLNGFTWSTEGTRALHIGTGSELTIINSVETEGYITSTGDSVAGGVINNENGTLNLRGGTIKLIVSDPNPVVNAGVIYQTGSAGEGVFNMYGGTITGGVINKTTNKNGYGGNVHIYFGTFNMYGGTIENGVANGAADMLSCGGNLAVRTDATANLFGGTITGGTADIGGSIYAQGAVNIAPEMVIDGEVYLTGANVNNYLANSLTYIDGDAYILHNVTFVLGADVTIAEVFENPTQIHTGKKGTADATVTIDLNGYTWTGVHRLYVEEGSTLNVKDSSENKTGVMQATGFGTQAGRIITCYGTVNIYGGTFTMVEDETVLVNGGGLIYISKGELNLYDGTITGGKVVANDTKSDGNAYGGNIYVYRGTFNIYGGTISNGSATGSETFDAFGGNICMRYGTTLNIEGGVISGGVSTDAGSNVCLGTKADGSNGAVMNKTAGTIENEDTSVEVAAAVAG